MAAPMKDEINSYISGNTCDASKQIAAEIQKNNGKFLELIESLGEYLTNSDSVTRGRATHLLGDVLQLLPVAVLTTKQIEVVVAFLLSKLSDHHSVQPHALQSLAVVTGHCCPLPSGLPEQICRTLFQEIQNQTLSHTDRRATYTIIQNLLGSAFKAIEGMGGDFVIGFIQQMDSEKDPRNLIICFNCAHFICSNMHLGPFAEEMFEILGCYFPIDFTPPVNDPHGITKEELILALRKCLAASSELAEYSVPLLLEKMTSDLQSARLDAFLTLIECAPVYGYQGLNTFLGSLTSSAKREVIICRHIMSALFNCSVPSEGALEALKTVMAWTVKPAISALICVVLMNLSPDLTKAARDAVKAVYSAVATSTNVNTSHENITTTTLVDLYQDITQYLQASDIKKSCLAYSLLQSVATASPSTLCTVASLSLSTLISQCSKETLPTELQAYLKELKGFLQVFQLYQTNENVIQVFKQHLPALFLLYENLLHKENNEVQFEAVGAITVLISFRLDSMLEKCDAFLDYLVKQSVIDHDQILRSQLLASLHVLVTENSGLRNKAVDSLTQLVKTTSSPLAAVALAHVVTDDKSFITVNGFLLSVIAQDITSDSVKHIVSYTEALSQLLTRLAGDKTCMSLVVNETALPLLRIAVAGLLQATEDARDKWAAVMSCFRDIFKVIGCSVELSDSENLWNRLEKLLMEGDTHCISLPGDFQTLKPLKPESSWQQTRLIALLEGYVTAGEIRAMKENHDAVFEAVFRLAVECEDVFSHLSACKCLAALLNKAPIGSNIHWLLEPIVERLKFVMASSESLARRQRAVTLWIWLTKAMESRAHSATGILSSHLITLLSDPDIGATVAENIGLVVEDIPDIFTPRLKGNITPLYKQRFFTLNLHSLLDGYHQAKSKEIKKNYLVAISQITSNLPLQVMKPHFSKLVPLLLLCLDQPGTTSHSQTLSTLCSAVINAPDVITQSIDSLIDHLLGLTKHDSSMKVRMSALKCLDSLAYLPTYTIVAHQKRIVRELADCLDDNKRLVRKQAAETRSAWILLEQIM